MIAWKETYLFEHPVCSQREVILWNGLASSIADNMHGIRPLRARTVTLQAQDGFLSRAPALAATGPQSDFTFLMLGGEFAGFISTKWQSPHESGITVRPLRPLAADGADFSGDLALAHLERILREGPEYKILTDIISSGGDLMYPRLITASLLLLQYPLDEDRFMANIRDHKLHWKQITNPALGRISR
jgi:hypothetical protein